MSEIDRLRTRAAIYSPEITYELCKFCLCAQQEKLMPKFLPKSELQALSLKAEGDCLTLNDLSTIDDKFGAAPQDSLSELSVIQS